MGTGLLSLVKKKNAAVSAAAKYKLWLVLLGMIIISTIVSTGVFIRPNTLLNLLVQNSIVGIVAMGQFMVILTGGIDLSVGSIGAASGMLCAFCLSSGYGILLSVLAALGMGLGLGLINGILVSKGKIPPQADGALIDQPLEPGPK